MLGESMKVLLRRVGDVPSAALERAAAVIVRELGLQTRLEARRYQPSLRAFDWSRLQYVASALLRELGPVDGFLTVYLVDADAYEADLNFVFGLALPGERLAGVFLKRLREEFYGREPNEELFIQRVEKEVLHELGHLLGLGHCDNPRCVMSFSLSIEDVDFKEAKFCEKCRRRLFAGDNQFVH